MNKHKILHSFYVVVMLVALVVFGIKAVQVHSAQENHVIGIKKTTDIKVVYQIKTDAWKQGVGSGLHYLQKLYNTYMEMEIDKEELDIHGVFHGEAAYWMLKDEIFKKAAKQPGPNPNKSIIEELVNNGVHIEICRKSMKKHGWQPKHILPAVTMVESAYPRIIDLQLRGYAYIRF